MATTRTAQLAAYKSTTTGQDVVVYTCPVGIRTIVKSAYFTNSDPTDRLLGLNANLQGPVQIVIFREVVKQFVAVGWEGWLVLEEGDFLTVYAQVPGGAAIISGTELPVFN